MTKNDMIFANRDNSRQIKTVQALQMHVLLSKKAFAPDNPVNFVQRERVAVFTPEEFRKKELLNEGKFKLDWVKVSGWQEARLIHDGELFARENPSTAKQINQYWCEILHPVKPPELTLEKLAQDIKKLKSRSKIQ